MPDGAVDINIGGLSTVDHETVNELHALGTLTTQLAGHDDLATLSSGFHNKTENTIAGPEKSMLSLSVNEMKFKTQVTFTS